MTISSDEPIADDWRDMHAAHARAIHHRAEVLASVRCGCFYCGSTFRPDEIQEWIDEDKDEQGQTAMCPRCGIDAVIGDKSGIALTQDFLARMNKFWF